MSLVSGGDCLRFWAYDDQKQRPLQLVHQSTGFNSVNSVAFNHTNQVLAACSEDGAMVLVLTTTGKLQHTTYHN
jgi:WD40 repeat protein